MERSMDDLSLDNTNNKIQDKLDEFIFFPKEAWMYLTFSSSRFLLRRKKTEFGTGAQGWWQSLSTPFAIFLLMIFLFGWSLAVKEKIFP